MRLVENNEIPQVSGGIINFLIELVMLPTLCSFAAGMQGVGVAPTLATLTTLNAVFASTYGGLNAHNPLAGALTGALGGSAVGFLEFTVGYGFGSLYRKEDAAA